MSYEDLIQRLFNVNLFGGAKLGLENAKRLQELLDFPDRSFKSIHIAGTNGKGSVSTKIAHALQKRGYRVGLYTSPHLSSFRERIRINGNMIPEESVNTLLPLLFKLTDEKGIAATFFELTTFLAFLYFSQEKVDVAVVETGLGGRLDATNVIHPILSVITSISLDHTDILGSTLDAIAKEKGGIIKEKTPVIIGPNVPFDLIQAIARDKKSPCSQVNSSSSLFEEENSHIAQAALDFLRSLFRLNQACIEEGLKARQPCRFEIVEGPLPIILDVAHNPNGIEHLLMMVNHHYPTHPIRFVFGLSKNKDLKSCLQCITKMGNHYHLVEAKNGRGASLETLYQQMRNLGIPDHKISSHLSIQEGVFQAKAEAFKHQEMIVICGSFFIMEEVRQALKINEPRDSLDLNERRLIIESPSTHSSSEGQK
ncbi:MAG: bifunctional folylpolyglutamate synthase/dihydrofolate synthase [Parachlamydiaceae bacterium]